MQTGLRGQDSKARETRSQSLLGFRQNFLFVKGKISPKHVNYYPSVPERKQSGFALFLRKNFPVGTALPGGRTAAGGGLVPDAGKLEAKLWRVQSPLPGLPRSEPHRPRRRWFPCCHSLAFPPTRHSFSPSFSVISQGMGLKSLLALCL